jgi:ABC-type bacteriocin/lantibiotic exporter with double-glycine peptidase domain
MTYEGAAEAITFLGLGLFLWAGAKQVLAGQLTIGGLVAFNSLVTLATVPIHNLLTLWDTLQRATVMLNGSTMCSTRSRSRGTIARGSVRCGT